ALHGPMGGLAACVHLRRVAGRQQGHFGEVLTSLQRMERLGQLASRNGHPLEELDRRRAVVQPYDDERHDRSNSLASPTRPARIRSSMPESRARFQSASSVERPSARMASRASASSSSSVSYSGPI